MHDSRSLDPDFRAQLRSAPLRFLPPCQDQICPVSAAVPAHSPVVITLLPQLPLSRPFILPARTLYISALLHTYPFTLHSIRRFNRRSVSRSNGAYTALFPPVIGRSLFASGNVRKVVHGCAFVTQSKHRGARSELGHHHGRLQHIIDTNQVVITAWIHTLNALTHIERGFVANVRTDAVAIEAR